MTLPDTAGAGSHDGMLDARIKGRNVLVLGTDALTLVIEACRLGAQHAVGADVDPERVRRAGREARRLGLPAEFLCLNIEGETPPGRFDVVACADVLQQVRNPVEVIDRLISLCRETLILQVPGPACAEARQYLATVGASQRQQRALENLPLILVGRNGTTKKHPESKFYMSSPALRNLLVHHRRHFAQVDISPAPHGRILARCQRRMRIGCLIFVAGPSAGGKTSFIRSLQEQPDGELAARLRISPGDAWQLASSNRLPEEPVVERLIFHYDFLRPWRRDARIFERDEALELIAAAQQLVFVTMWAPPEQLLARVRNRITRLAKYRNLKQLRFYFFVRALTRARRFSLSKLRDLLALTREHGTTELQHLHSQESIEILYRTPERVLDRYHAWFEFCSKFDAQTHWIADTSQIETRLVPLSDWLTRHAGEVDGAGAPVSPALETASLSTLQGSR